MPRKVLWGSEIKLLPEGRWAEGQMGDLRNTGEPEIRAQSPKSFQATGERLVHILKAA